MGFLQKEKTEIKDENIFEAVEPDDLVKFGLIPELIGRLHVIASLKELDLPELVKVFKEPKNSILRQYQKLFAIDEAKLTFTEDAIEAICKEELLKKDGS